ncbi:hypothetical protein [Chitinophaga solisilvae]|uniref:hypothetical protein n=1 Tax=Chitinophaga solisilvae TaxID=1233460 RepID=UPI0013715560|nr:hypothetical protein [Chitinophaga solisilvae]
MKYFLVMCISLGLLLQNFSKSLIVMQFQAQQSYIAKVLCENRSKPEMHCNGKCYLKKKLDRDTRQEKNSNMGKERFEVMFVNAIPTLQLDAPDEMLQHSSFYCNPLIVSPVYSIFHPPQPQVC